MEDGHHELTDDVFAALALVHAAPHRLTVGVGLEVDAVWAHRVKTDAARLDLLLVLGEGGDDRFMSSGLQAQGDSNVRVQVAQRAERREDDPPPGLTRFRIAYRHSHRTAATGLLPRN